MAKENFISTIQAVLDLQRLNIKVNFSTICKKDMALNTGATKLLIDGVDIISKNANTILVNGKQVNTTATANYGRSQQEC